MPSLDELCGLGCCPVPADLGPRWDRGRGGTGAGAGHCSDRKKKSQNYRRRTTRRVGKAVVFENGC